MANNPNPVEDLGYAYVQFTCARANAIWRRLGEKDVGVDGLIEMSRRDGASLYVAAQVKSGNSWFRGSSNGFVRLYLGEQLQRLHNYLIPAIIVVYRPDSNLAYWVSIRDYVADHPQAMEKGQIDISLDSLFSENAFAQLREDARVVLTPVLSAEEVREFLELNRRITVTGFVELAKHVLNSTGFLSRRGIPDIAVLKDNGLLWHEEPDHLPGWWYPTAKGTRYIQFMLGDRYFLPFVLIQPQRSVTDADIQLCMDPDAHLGIVTRAKPKGNCLAG